MTTKYEDIEARIHKHLVTAHGWPDDDSEERLVSGDLAAHHMLHELQDDHPDGWHA